MSRTAWTPAPRTSPELYEQIEVPEPGDPGYPGPELPAGDRRAGAVNQVRTEIETDYAYAQADVNAIWDGPEPEAEAEI